MNRLRLIFARYGWRTLPVVIALTLQRITRALRSTLSRGWLSLITQGIKGRELTLGRGLRVSPGSLINLGDGVTLGERCVFEIGVNPQARVSLGEQTWISHDCHLSSNGSVELGAHVLVGEFVSLRDTSHSYARADIPIAQQDDVVGWLRIEDDVWIGRGCLILGRAEGVTIGRGCVIAANSVVSRSIPPMQVWGGAPARFLKHRECSEFETHDSSANEKGLKRPVKP